jgi:hypothetical protein
MSCYMYILSNASYQSIRYKTDGKISKILRCFQFASPNPRKIIDSVADWMPESLNGSLTEWMTSIDIWPWLTGNQTDSSNDRSLQKYRFRLCCLDHMERFEFRYTSQIEIWIISINRTSHWIGSQLHNSRSRPSSRNHINSARSSNLQKYRFRLSLRRHIRSSIGNALDKYRFGLSSLNDTNSSAWSDVDWILTAYSNRAVGKRKKLVSHQQNNNFLGYLKLFKIIES